MLKLRPTEQGVSQEWSASEDSKELWSRGYELECPKNRITAHISGSKWAFWERDTINVVKEMDRGHIIEGLAGKVRNFYFI